jgi:uncharacterized protein YukE
MDLLLDKDAFDTASRILKTKCEDLRTLRGDIDKSFAQLKIDWDSDAGRAFFAKYETNLVENLKKYSTVFEYMSKNLMTASNKYDEVFGAANAVADAQY